VTLEVAQPAEHVARGAHDVTGRIAKQDSERRNCLDGELMSANGLCREAAY
jgi:hypothetical protein